MGGKRGIEGGGDACSLRSFYRQMRLLWEKTSKNNLLNFSITSSSVLLCISS